MSYCVNCGVELAESEKCCPLCGVEVMNPAKPFVEPTETPYPKRIDRLMKRVDRQFISALTALFLLIPVFVTVFTDIAVNKTISWSAYVVGSVAMAYVYILLPYRFTRLRLMLYLSADLVATVLFLYLVERLTMGGWFFKLGFPITMMAGLSVLLVAYLFMKYNLRKPARAAIVLFLAGFLCLCVEITIATYRGDSQLVVWSPYPLVIGAVLGVIALIINRRQRLKEEVKKRFFI